jgi:hypothetical protein
MGIFSTGAGGAVRAARDAGAAQAGRASNAVLGINQIFGDPSREAGRLDFLGALRAQLADTTMRGFTTGARQNKFALARRGLTGGQVDVDTQRRSLEDLFRRQIGDETQAQDAYRGLVTGDEQQRQGLIRGAYGVAGTGIGGARDFASQLAAGPTSFAPAALWGAATGAASAYGRGQNRSLYNAGYGV